MSNNNNPYQSTILADEVAQTVPNYRTRAGLTVWFTQTIFLAVIMLSGYEVINLLYQFIANSFTQENTRTYIFILSFVLFGLYLYAFIGIYKRKMHARWIGMFLLLAYSLLAFAAIGLIANPESGFLNSDIPRMTRSYIIVYVTISILLAFVLMIILGFSKKVKSYFIPMST